MAQIVPASDGTGTIVTPNGSRFDITGGQRSRDNANLFHSFNQFGLTQTQIANFIADPSLQNIFARVTGGSPSSINGLIQLTGGTTNLYLINPTGILFGANASLNVPASFIATNASSIQLSGGQTFHAVGGNNYSELVGSPISYQFTNSTGNVSSIGTLRVNPGSELLLLANSTAGPQMLTGGNAEHATQLLQNNLGQNVLAGSGLGKMPPPGGAGGPGGPNRPGTPGMGDRRMGNSPPPGQSQPGGNGTPRPGFRPLRDRLLGVEGGLPFPQHLPAADANSMLVQLEDYSTNEFNQYLGQSLDRSNKNLTDLRATLKDIEARTHIKSVVIYATFVANSATPSTNQATADDDPLEIFIVTATNQSLQEQVTGATRGNVLKVAQQFQQEVANPRKVRTRSYLASAQQLYQWLIAPVEQELQALQAQNVIFVVDAGLRSIPFAALHDGKQFLIERYSVGLMPSFSLTDTRYVDVRQTNVLAMGSSQFMQQEALPAVAEEINAITTLWTGRSFLNEEFTLQNLKVQRQQQPFGIIHLATHAEFRPGSPKNSYIQFSDAQLQLDQIQQLGWNKPPVELLVLSACQTALGDREAEMGFAGLAVKSGVKSALASLWYVSDEGTLQLMTGFYGQLKQTPVKAEALRAAQLAMLNGIDNRVESGQLRQVSHSPTSSPTTAPLTTKPFSHPYYWAAFTLIGSPW